MACFYQWENLFLDIDFTSSDKILLKLPGINF